MADLFTVLPALAGKPWLCVLEIVDQPPFVFQVHGEAARCVELKIHGRKRWVRIEWDADHDGTRAELVDAALELARTRRDEPAERDSHEQGRLSRLLGTTCHAFESELRAASAIAADALARKEQAERQIADAERRRIARDQVQAASALFASVAHDIRSPLTALVLNLRVLEEEALSSESLTESARSVFEDTRYACDLIEGVLDGLRTYASCSGVPRRLPMRPIIDCVVRLFRWHMQQKGVALSVSVEGEPEAWGTTAEICQVLLNLLANAAEASPRGSTVALACCAGDAEVFVRVDDDGPGIGPGDPEQVFEPFRSTKDQGFGLGLTVARAMARRHGGDLVVTTPRRRGASFELKLPRSPH
ncbi:MAG: HAMP domain-containing histidine kinase [Deltaproteobacteria bacterium]|nr:HAMP domain-containing histidine kinase [Deltaproteobacteria bacterium]